MQFRVLIGLAAMEHQPIYYGHEIAVVKSTFDSAVLAK